MFKKIFLFFVGLISLSIISVTAAYLGLIVFSSDEKIDRESIQSILSRQSPVYYEDGENILGVFFRNSHRLYVPFDRIPRNFVNAIVAAEDHEFFSHSGVDIPGIIRAFIANVKAGRIVQGGSTITQQTAKNLLKREERSLKAKLKELLYALRLENHYSKEEILTFYANQFYVSGNGRGLGVAARYYFDKEVDELNLVECAFIAGSVKGPNHYNPFTKGNPEAKEIARERAKERTSYVLEQMYDLGMIKPVHYHSAIQQSVPFNKGRMRYQLNTVMDMVEEGLNADIIQQALARYGIDNPATSGIRITTTIDKDIQEIVVHSLRSNLSRLDIRLSGYDREIIQKKYSKFTLKKREQLAKGDFLVGRVVEIKKGEQPRIEVSLSGKEQEGGLRGIISKEGLIPAFTALVKYHRQRWSAPGKKDWPLLLNQIEKGDLIYVSVKGSSAQNKEYELVLEKYPELQGGALVVRDGLIRGLIGGYDNFYFNRAVQARRPMGSTFKAPLYAAAIQLGWNNLDILDNRKRAFVYQNDAYVPRPDHYSPHEKVSLAWAGVNSENVASVWLLYNLCNKLTPAQFKDLLSHVGLAPNKGESYTHYKRRVRDRMGIVVDERTLERTAFINALSLSKADLAFAGRADELPLLKLLTYYDHFKDLESNGTDSESKIKKEIADYNFEHFKDLKEQLMQTVSRLSNLPTDFSTDFLTPPKLSVNNLYIRSFPEGKIFTNRRYLKMLAETEFIFTLEDPGEGWESVRRQEFLDFLAGLKKEEFISFLNSVKLDNLLSLETFNIVENSVNDELKRLKRYPRYSPEVLHSVPDFRVLAGLRYVIDFCHAAGIGSDLKPVLSFPLGSNVVSLFELSRLYEGLLTGEIREYGQKDNVGLNLISQITAPSGEVIYSADPEVRQIADSRTVLEVSDILKNVVSHGTGRYAGRRVKIREKPSSFGKGKSWVQNLGMPLFGKTGTSDNYTNSVFIGGVPGISNNGVAHKKVSGVSLEKPDIIGAYVGYDDNRPMVRTSTHITGASGGLRVWTQIAKHIVERKNYADYLDLVDLAFAGSEKVPLNYPDLGQILVPVNRENGIPDAGLKSISLGVNKKTSVATFGQINNQKGLKLNRYYQPFWRQAVE